MMRASKRDFESFDLTKGDSVYELADGLIPELGERLSVDMGREPNLASLGALVGRFGSDKVLRDNPDAQGLERGEMVELLNRSGVQRSLERSLWTPDITPGTLLVDTAVMTGGVANWQDRSAGALPAWFRGTVFMPTGNRIMNSVTELTNGNVVRLQERTGRVPTEAEYAASVIVPKLVSKKSGVQPFLTVYPTGKGDELAQRFFEDNPALLDEKLLVVRVANAGVQLAVQLRQAARKLDSAFDNDPANPQLFIATDHFPIAHNEREEKRPSRFQSPQTGLRQAVLTAKKILEAQQQD